MSNDFSSSNRLQREGESRMSNERSRDFSGAPSHRSDQGSTDRRDPGAEALLELARLIGSQNDPLAPEASKVESRLSDVSRTAVSQADAGRAPFIRPQDRSYENRFEGRPSPDRGASGRHEPDFGAALGATLGKPDAEPSRRARAGGFDFPEPTDRSDYPGKPRQAAADVGDFDLGNRGGPAYRRRRDEYSEQHADGGEYDEPEDYGEDEPEAPRRRSTKVIMAVLGLAVFGSVAAYGYRTLVNASSSEPPPIIKADTSPSKITPMSDVKAESGGTGDRIGSERMVRRDEEPVDLGTSSGPGGAGGAADVAPAAAGPAATGLPSDPRRVHTVPIRADQGAASFPDRPAPRAAAQAAAQAPPQAQPSALQPRQLAAAAPPPQPASPAPQRQAAVAPAASAPPDTAALAPAESGGFVLQVLAVRSEADAQTEFRRLQGKYSSVLGGRQPLIRRKDRGDQGVFYVAQVGPFGTKSDADQLCDALKTAGGTCYVYKN
jgi:cell division septation protein DedD